MITTSNTYQKKSEQTGQLPDVLDVAEEATTFNLFNTPTHNLNYEMDNAMDKTNLIAEEVEENANMNKINAQSGDVNMETAQYPSYPHTSGTMGATANDSPRSRTFFLLLLLLHVCVFVVACMFLGGVAVVAFMCFIVGFVCVWCEFLHFLSSVIT